MKKILLICAFILAASAGLCSAQQVYYESACILIDCSAMPSVNRKPKLVTSGKTKKHTCRSDVNEQLPSDYLVSPTDVTTSGAPGTELVALADIENACANYRGPFGSDPLNSWRVPTLNELQMVLIMHDCVYSSFKFTQRNYFTATMNTANTNVMCVDFQYGIIKADPSVTPKNYLRCVRDNPGPMEG